MLFILDFFQQCLEGCKPFPCGLCIADKPNDSPGRLDLAEFQFEEYLQL